MKNMVLINRRRDTKSFDLSLSMWNINPVKLSPAIRSSWEWPLSRRHFLKRGFSQQGSIPSSFRRFLALLWRESLDDARIWKYISRLLHILVASAGLYPFLEKEDLSSVNPISSDSSQNWLDSFPCMALLNSIDGTKGAISLGELHASAWERRSMCNSFLVLSPLSVPIREF